ncbi:uncharacterized protein LOC123663599 [Melitaea cinxia]|uniref:uncharacterized protein LOC123663599 n=1 Tax=Melitaea cinxia TaxID=113334 RepID=UPI001E273190|nr:uncharacterized protein LOC123663599 [Melitaea cinxia]
MYYLWSKEDPWTGANVFLKKFPLDPDRFQDITNSENVQWNENILSKNAEYSFLPLPSTSQPPQGLTFEKTLDSTLTEREKILLSHLTQTKLSLKCLAVEMRTPVVYVSGYLAAKLLDRTKYQKCHSLKVDKPVDDLNNYISFKEWWKDSSSLCFPSKPLCHFVNKSQIHFKAIISQDLQIKNIKQ